MVLTKICPSCGSSNAVGENLCSKCHTPIMGVLPIESTLEFNENLNKDTPTAGNEKLSIDSSMTVNESDCLKLRSDNGRIICISNNDIIGRSAVGKEVLTNRLVSGKHAIVTKRNNQWFIMDNCSTNFTFLNGDKLEPDTEKPINSGDLISLSTQVNLRVQK